MIKTLAKNIKGFVKESVLTPFFMILEVIVETIIPFIENKEKLMEICDAALNFFAENAKPSERFKFTIDRVGREKFEQRILEVYNG